MGIKFVICTEDFDGKLEIEHEVRNESEDDYSSREEHYNIETIYNDYQFKKGVCFYHINGSTLKPIKNYYGEPILDSDGEIDLERAKELASDWGQGFAEDIYEKDNLMDYIENGDRISYVLDESGTRISRDDEIIDGIPFEIVSMW